MPTPTHHPMAHEETPSTPHNNSVSIWQRKVAKKVAKWFAEAVAESPLPHIIPQRLTTNAARSSTVCRLYKEGTAAGRRQAVTQETEKACLNSPSHSSQPPYLRYSQTLLLHSAAVASCKLWYHHRWHKTLTADTTNQASCDYLTTPHP